MSELFGIHWAGINKFFLLPFFLLLIFFIIKNYLVNKKLLQSIVYKDNQKYIFKNFSSKKILFKTVLKVVALFFIFVSMLQPQWDKKDVNVEQEGRDLLIALDISKSMLSQDLKPNRLEFSKLKIRKLLKKLDFERVGLILFSGTAFLQCPLTADHSAFLMFLDQVDTETIASGTTSIAQAIKTAVDVFKKCKERKNKILLLVTDGEDFSLNLDFVKNQAQKENLKVFALGVGTEAGAPIPIIGSNNELIGHEVDQNGKIALSKLNSDSLRNITQRLSGCFFRFTYDDDDLASIVKLIQSYEKEKFEDKMLSCYQDQYPWFLAIAFLSLAIEWIL